MIGRGHSPGSVFISYRRTDSSGHAGRLYDRLSSRFGDDQIFMDIDAIEPGVDFVQRIRQAMASCRVVLVIIGPDWLTAADANGNRRLDDPRDYVRMEIAEALASDVRVIPVLVRGAGIPSAAEVPDDLRGLTTRQAHELSDRRWGFDTTRLMEVIERVVSEPPEAAPSSGAPRGGWSRWAVSPSYAIVLVVALVVGAGVWLLFSRVQRSDGGRGDVPLPGASLSTVASPQATVPGTMSSESTPGVIAFVSDRSGSDEVWTMNVDGTDVRRVTDGGAEDLVHPDWSPDGQRIVFASNSTDGTNTDGDMEIWMVNADGGDLRQLTDNDGVRDAAPDWSPDGERIAFSSQRSNGDDPQEDLEIWTMNSSDGQDAEQLTDNTVDDDTPDWSPDGRQIAWETNLGADHDIYRMNADGSAPVEVVGGDGGDFWPMWSPDGDHIAFRSNRDGGGNSYDIYTVTPEGEGLVRLTSDGADNHRPNWSPDGREIAFDAATDGQEGTRRIYAVAAGGGEARPLTDGSMWAEAPAWQPSAGPA